MNIDRTTVTRLTSATPSAIAVLAIDGPMAMEYVSRVWRPNQGDSRLKLNAIRYGYTRIEGQTESESIVVCRTAQQRVEVHCHGGRMASESIRQALIALGAVEQTPEQLVDSPSHLVAAEAREDLVRALTLRTTSILLDQMRGALQREFDEISSFLESNQHSVALSKLAQLQSRASVGRHLIEPWKVVLAGPPNSGKSSLLNLLLGYSRAIVHEQAGTTRDLLAENSSFAGWPIELIDGAGIRQATDAIEATGVERTLTQISAADCVLLLVDSTTGWTETHTKILNQCSGEIVLVSTKSDLYPNQSASHIPSQIYNSIAASVKTSSVTGQGLQELIHAIVTSLVPFDLQPGEPVPFRERHRNWIAKQIARVEPGKCDLP